jgi:hypothetical protein
MAMRGRMNRVPGAQAPGVLAAKSPQGAQAPSEELGPEAFGPGASTHFQE